MQNELPMLSRRIQRLETLIGVNQEHIHTNKNDEKGSALKQDHLAWRLEQAKRCLKQQVPDEAVAAYWALAMLNKTVTLNGPSLSSHLDCIKQQITDIEPKLSLLQETIGSQKDEFETSREQQQHVPPHISSSQTDQLSALQYRIDQLSDRVESEESHVDDLLMSFDAATARLNTTILALSSQLQSASSLS